MVLASLMIQGIFSEELISQHIEQVVHMCVYVYMCVYGCVCVWMRVCVYDIA